MVKGFPKGARVYHAEQGPGHVVLRDRENVGIRFDNGNVGAYGSSYFDRFPTAVAYIDEAYVEEQVDTSDIPEADEAWFARAQLVRKRPANGDDQ